MIRLKYKNGKYSSYTHGNISENDIRLLPIFDNICLVLNSENRKYKAEGKIEYRDELIIIQMYKEYDKNNNISRVIIKPVSYVKEFINNIHKKYPNIINRDDIIHIDLYNENTWFVNISVLIYDIFS